jgi:hypothetical protein
MTQIFIALFIFLLVYIITNHAAELYVKWLVRREDNETKYENLYRSIQDDLWGHESSEVIRTKLKKLDSLKYKNDEKTSKLKWNFLDKFYRDQPKSIEFLSLTQQLKEVNKNRV